MKSAFFPTAMSCVENIYQMLIGVENQITAFSFYALFPHKILSYSCGVTQMVTFFALNVAKIWIKVQKCCVFLGRSSSLAVSKVLNT